MNPPDLAQQIKRQLNERGGEIYLTAEDLTAMENTAGTVHQWLRNHGYTHLTALMPDGPHSDLISLREDNVGSGTMAIHRYLDHIRWCCYNCARQGPRHPATDHGADQAGVEMIRHTLDQPDCAGEAWLESCA